MKIAVLGSGAMGCLYGGKLAEAGYDVTLIDVWKDHIDAINNRGLHIEGIEGERTVRSIRAVSSAEEAGPCDLLIVFVKATLTAQAVESARGIIGERTSILTLQNGLGNVEKISAVVEEEKVIAGVTGHGSTLLGPGKIRHAGQGVTVIGELNGAVDERLRCIGAVLEKGGFDVKLSQNVMGLIWGKLLVNIGINALTAITGLKNGRLVDFSETDELLRSAVEEAVAVAKGKGVILEGEDPVEHARNVARLTATNRSSMLQDVSNKRKTEIDVINGAIVQEGKRLGIPTPVNKVLYNLVSVKEKTYEEV
ncbi:2-dehydropantoate 2-reductase [Aminobacterium sp. EBM-42]|jgi:2-dehydropantoate 2-reductase|uniref:ketopantoate reductase family protein n=1 Tax=Aminobacterium TaxID=81466 RepID=UPI000A4950E0|nr:2-dehydropantoate 2-reductase [Aminobacterium sp. EBM-42]NLK30095.1 2-dehydropantoate 2-reductase [Aminobacterium colombiense]